MTSSSRLAIGQSNRIDRVRPDAPELACYGPHPVGVRTLEVIDPGRPDVLAALAGERKREDRRLTVEVWYPARLSKDQTPGCSYETVTRDPSVRATLHGSAVRDAAPREGSLLCPLLIISHGYPGNRYLLSHLGENLASKGYVAVAIDHRDSTYDDEQAFASTLYNRAPDQRAAISGIAELAAGSSFLNGLVDAGNTALIGYSMGGYGVLNNLGAGYSEALVESPLAPPDRMLEVLAASHADFPAGLDPRIKAGIALAPWGMNNGVWEASGLSGITRPLLLVAGDADTTSGYHEGVREIFRLAVNSERYLLTFENAGHNAAAPIPLPVELSAMGNLAAASHYLDPVWDTVRMNNILNHFATAFLDLHLKQQVDRRSYLEVTPRASDGRHSMDEQGAALADHSYWKGFPPGSGIGLILEKGNGAHQ